MPIDQRTERRIAAREIGRNLGVAVEHLKVGVRLVGAGTIVVVGAGALLAGFFGCYFVYGSKLRQGLHDAEAELRDAEARAEKAERDQKTDRSVIGEQLRVAVLERDRAHEELSRKRRDADAPAASTVVAATPSVPIGGLAELRSDGGGTAVIVAASVELLDRARELRRLNDDVGLAKMLVDGEIGLLDNGTKVRVLKREGFLAPKMQVRVLEGSVYGHAVWVRDEHVQPQR